MSRQHIFVGNRRFVLEEMLTLNVPLAHVFCIQGSHLERDLLAGFLGDIPYTLIKSKQQLLDEIALVPFDVLVSNGCPYILPINVLPKAQYVNIHPSPLPDLRGIDPVIGAVLHNRAGGATCHVMDAGIDTGAIISQVSIPMSPDLDVTTLYQLSFIAEKQAFREAFLKDFVPCKCQGENTDIIYYNRQESDMILSHADDNETMLRKIKSFNNKSIGCSFKVQGALYKVFIAMRMENEYLCNFVLSFPENVVVLSYENSIVFHRDGEVLRFMNIESKQDKTLSVGQQLFGK